MAPGPDRTPVAGVDGFDGVGAADDPAQDLCPKLWNAKDFGHPVSAQRFP
jgi:hypothetical protein